MSPRLPLALVRDMFDSAERIAWMLEEISEEQFLDSSSAAIQDAVSNRLVVIGEAAASLLS